MDLEYKNMCIYNESLQNLFKANIGDPVLTIENEIAIITTIVDDKNVEITISNGFNKNPNHNNLLKKILQKDELTWIPFQHQIQGLLSIPVDSMIQDFLDFVNMARQTGQNYTLLEKWWLVYYMDNTYSLNWNNGRWE